MKPTIKISELDFDLIKESIKQYLKDSGSPISDYDYEGSAANILLDILAVNTHYNSYYGNMVANEMFSDSAVLRSSVVSHGKTRGYSPRSSRCSTATINLTISPADVGVGSLVVPKGTLFTTKVNDTTYNYINVDDVFLESDGTDFSGEVKVYAGTLYSEEIVYEEGKRIILKNKNIDTSFMKVVVQNSENDLRETIFSSGIRYLSLTSTTNAYFTYETDLSNIEIRFGDGVLGTALVPGNVVKVEYIVANTSVPPGSRTFTVSPSLYTNKTKEVEIVSRASGFIPPESIKEIKQAIQRVDATQYRSVIPEDYKENIKQDNPEIIDVAVWGGQDNEPPLYGRVIVSPVIRDLSFIPDSMKDKISSDLKRRSVISARPMIVEPEIVYCVASGFVRFAKEYDIQESTIKGLVEEGLQEYAAEHLGFFGGSLNPTLLGKVVDLKHESIYSVVLEFRIYTEFDIDDAKLNSYEVHFRNKINPYSIVSDVFKLTGNPAENDYLIKDEPLNDLMGEVFIFVRENGDAAAETKSVKVGDVNYETGYVTLNNFSGTTTLGTILRVWTKPTFSEFVSKQNTILLIDIAESIKNIQAIKS